MKWILSVSVYTCVFFTIVSSGKINKLIKNKDLGQTKIELEPKSIYEPNENFLKEGTKNVKVACKGSSKKIEWYNPDGELVERDPSNGVHVMESALSRTPSLTLVWSVARTSDSGVWECRSDGQVQSFSMCVLDPVEFLDTVDELITDEGRSITISCKTKGNPEPKIQWYKNEKLLIDDGKKFFMSTKYNLHNYEGLLTVMSLTPEDMGDYTCEAYQENPDVEECSDTATINITLNVNYAPTYFEGMRAENYTEYVFALDEENVTLVCNPHAYPPPEFRWFTANMANEYTNKQFKIDNGTQSILSLIANTSTFNKKFICKAKNDLGELFTTYQILKKQKPVKLSATSDFDVQHRAIYFNITWEQEIVFPVDGIDIQYFEKKTIGEPKDWQWELAKFVNYDVEDSFLDMLVPLERLTINTEYWVRLRAYNDLGKGPWSNNILASTAYEVEVQPAGFDLGVLLGIIVTAVIIVFAGGCITIIKKL